MIDLAAWPFNMDEREQELLRQALSRAETRRQVEQIMGAFLLGDILTDILTQPRKGKR